MVFKREKVYLVDRFWGGKVEVLGFFFVVFQQSYAI